MIVNPEARTAIEQAISLNAKANIEAQFEDGVDHLHLEVWDGRPQR